MVKVEIPKLNYAFEMGVGRRRIRERERERDVAYTKSIIWHVNFRRGKWKLPKL